MSSTRSIIAPPPFAENALTVIPPTPVAGVSYRDLAAGPASSPDGWPYAERVNSAEFNQIMYQMSALLSIMDKKGILGWSSLVDYTESAITFGSDGLPYLWIAASGPANGGAKDPISNPAFWAPFLAGKLIGVQRFIANGTYTPTPGTTSIIVEAVGGGGGGGSSGVTGAGQVSTAYGGSGGTYGKARYTTGFAGAAVTIGAGGAGGVTPGPATGTTGGATSLGLILSCPGGAGGIGGPVTGAANLPTLGSPLTGPASGANILSVQGSGSDGPFVFSTGTNRGGAGGSTFWGPGAPQKQAGAGNAATSPGSGGSGAAVGASSGGSFAGGAGAPGLMIIWEYQ